MAFPRPRSLTGMLLIGLGLTLLPLGFAAFTAQTYLRGLADQSESLVALGTQASKNSQLVLEQIPDLERTARLYLVLGDEELLDAYRERQARLGQALDALALLPQTDAAREQLAAMRAGSLTILRTLETVPLPENAGDLVLDVFETLNTAAGGLSAASQRAIEEEVSVLQSEGQEARRRLAWQAAALVPAMLIILGLFYALVIRPLRRLDRAIDLLGKGSLSQSIEVSGPSDLAALGEQLEWLRLRLIEISEEKNRFLRHMSHELKTPLANMREGSELLMDGAVGDLSQDQHDVTRILRDNSLKLQQLIENLLSFSAWQARNADLEFKPVRIQPLVESVLRQHRLSLAGGEIDVATHLEDIELIGDKEKIRLVVDNLLTNAMKFTPRGGNIHIEAGVRGEEAVIEIRDSGPGVPKAERHLIFEAFYRGSARQRGRLEGTGIGLSVVAECVQAHSGRVEILDAPGGGALFRVTLPLEQLAASA